MATIDLTNRVCPNCGSAEFPIRSREQLTGSCGVNVFDDGVLDWDGTTEIDWSTQETQHFYCDDCANPLPADWQQAIWQALNRHIVELGESQTNE